MVTVIGFAFKIPEAVMGLTFLAAGGCLPEAFSAIIMARKGIFFIKRNEFHIHNYLILKVMVH